MKDWDATKYLKICSPGRVNLIGEHTDYSLGYVMPMAIDLHTYLEAVKSEEVILYSESLRDGGRFKVDVLERENSWLDYVKGIYYILQRKGYRVGGMHGRIYGNLPIGSGLSSSASLELAILEFLNSSYDLNLKRIEMAIIAQEAENEFVGMPCGIMDQMAIVLGKEKHGIFIDTENLRYEYVPIPPELQILIFDTGVRRSLATSAYKDRRKTIENALKKLGKRSSKYVDEKELEKLNSMERKRLGYVLRENRRVIEARDALKEGDLEKLGKIITDAHKDLASNFEVSCQELDFFVSLAIKCGAIGARLTGAGFGGSAIALFLRNPRNCGEEILKEYRKKFIHNAKYYIVRPSEGVRRCMD